MWAPFCYVFESSLLIQVTMMAFSYLYTKGILLYNQVIQWLNCINQTFPSRECMKSTKTSNPSSCWLTGFRSDLITLNQLTTRKNKMLTLLLFYHPFSNIKVKVILFIEHIFGNKAVQGAWCCLRCRYKLGSETLLSR